MVNRYKRFLLKGSIMLFLSSLVLCMVVFWVFSISMAPTGKNQDALVGMNNASPQRDFALKPESVSVQPGTYELETGTGGALNPDVSLDREFTSDSSNVPTDSKESFSDADPVKALFDPGSLTAYEATQTELGSVITVSMSEPLSRGMTSVLKKAESSGKWSLTFADYLDLFGQTFSCVLQDTEKSRTYLMFARPDQQDSTTVTTIILDASAHGFQELYTSQESGGFHEIYQ